MARRPRLLRPGATYHVMARGNRKTSIFDDDEDRQILLATVDEVTADFEVGCYAFCLMGNHYHLVLATPRGNLSSAMRDVNGRYAQASNRRHGRSGHLFEGRFDSRIIETETYLREVVRYVALNPVRAGLVSHPSSWPWSSYASTAGLETPPSFLDLSWLQWIFGGACHSDAQLRYRMFVDEALAQPANVDVAALTLATRHFDRALRRDLGVDHDENRLPRALRALGRPSLNELFGPPGQSRAERDRLIREAHVRYGYTLREIGLFLGLNPGTPSVLLRRRKA